MALVRVPGVVRQQREFAEFYAANRDRCLRAVLAVVGDRQLAEDLVAEGFTRAWMSWSKVSTYAAPQAWVVRAALNIRVSWWRRRRREVALDGYDRAAPLAEESGVDPALITAVRRLPGRQREVIALRVLLDLDTATTAKVLGIAAGTVTAHLSRAVAMLREHLVPADNEEVRQ